MFEFIGGAISGFLGFSYFFDKSTAQTQQGRPALKTLLTGKTIQLLLAVVILLVTAFSKTIHIDQSWIQIILGISFGAAARYWSSEALPYEKKTNDMWHLFQWIGVLGTLLIVGLSYPYMTKYMENVNSFKLGQMEVTFLNGLTKKAGVVTPVETPYYFHEISPSNQIERGLYTLKGTPRVIEKDLLIFGLKKQLQKTQNIDAQIVTLNNSAKLYQSVFSSLIDCAIASYNEKLVFDVIRAQIRPIALQLRYILLKQDLNSRNNDDELEELFIKINKAIMEFNQLMIGDPKECDSLLQYKDHNWTIDNIKELAKANYIFHIAANLMFLGGSMDAAIDLLEKSPDLSEVNVNYQLARLKYWRGDDLKSVLLHYDRMRDFAQSLSGQVQKAEKLKLSVNGLSDIESRAKNIQRGAENSIAYFSSLLNIRRSVALEYAERYYKDHKEDASAIDTYALANMVFADDSEKTEKVEQSIELFEEALEYAESMEESANKKKLITEISNHLLQANRLLYFLTNAK